MPLYLVLALCLILKVKEADEIRSMSKLRFKKNLTAELLLDLLGNVKSESDSLGI